MKTHSKTAKEPSYAHLAHQLRLYLNHYPTLCGLRSSQGSFASRCCQINPTAEYTPPAQLTLAISDINYHQVHLAFHSLSITHQRALRLLYDVSYYFHPGIEQNNREPRQVTFIGEQLQFYSKLYGAKAPLVLMNQYCNDWQHLRLLHNKRLASKLTPEQHQLSFLIGEQVRDLYHQAHRHFQQALSRRDCEPSSGEALK